MSWRTLPVILACLLAFPFGFGVVAVLVQEKDFAPTAPSKPDVAPAGIQPARRGGLDPATPPARTAPSSAPAQPAVAARKPCPIDGTWSNPAMSLTIDCAEGTASNEAGPRQVRGPLTIQDVTDDWVVFDIGHERYFGLLQGKQLSVTSVSTSGEQVLVHQNAVKNTGH